MSSLNWVDPHVVTVGSHILEFSVVARPVEQLVTHLEVVPATFSRKAFESTHVEETSHTLEASEIKLGQFVKH